MEDEVVSHFQSTFMESESWHIDYIEGEVTEAQKTDIELLLDHSPTEKGAVDNLNLLKEKIRECEGVELPREEIYWQDLHAKIMVAVEESSAVKWNKEKVSRKGRGARR